MHFFPGCEILRSFDLMNWEHVSYVYDRLDSTENQRLLNGKNSYGQGMWAATLRHHEGVFYVLFVANDTHRTYLFTSRTILGPWNKQIVEGFYHDASLLFDDDGRIFIVYGNTDIWLTEMKNDLSGPKADGIHTCIISEKNNPNLGYEGAHVYKIERALLYFPYPFSA
ncbi:MAG: family 43 glycosylhydrolase [Alkalibacterium sp.]|nr:family 43 glycosylhydrolase [Alkalibacterium sp.]